MLLWEYLRFLKAFQPKFFLMENVRGLLSAALRHRPIKDRPEKGGPPLEPDERPGSVIELWLADLMHETDAAYRVDCFEVNAVNYGAPQLRERVLFIGNRFGRVVDFSQPTHGEVGLIPFATLGMALDSVRHDDGTVLDFSPRKKHYLAMVPEGGNWRALPSAVQQQSMGRAWFAKGGRSGWWRRLTRDLPSPTIVTMPNHAGTSMCHPVETRALTLKECAAVQEFPPEWEFVGTVQQKYTQVGNAIPTRLGDVAGKVIAQHLDSLRGSPVTEGKDRVENRRIYIRSHVRTRQWYRDGETFLWSSSGNNEAARYSAQGRRRPAAKAV
jgi:DNA (cytosine-5)-methyltransferase 1